MLLINVIDNIINQPNRIVNIKNKKNFYYNFFYIANIDKLFVNYYLKRNLK